MCMNGHYSPAIRPDLIKRLYYERKRLKKPMTKVVNEIIEEYFARRDFSVMELERKIRGEI